MPPFFCHNWCMTRLLGALAVLALMVAGAWYSIAPPGPANSAETEAGDAWLDRLYSRNPREVEAATVEVKRLGARVVPVIQQTLRNEHSEAERLKAALKASGIVGRAAAPAVPDVASVLDEPALTAEAAVALSYMGPDAFPPLRDALTNPDPIVRREALRSIGKLRERAPLPNERVLPLLVAGMRDRNEGVRTVAATYLGIIHDGAEQAVPALIAGLSDPDSEVRRASAVAIGSFGEEAALALPELRKAARDRNDDVAREAGRSIVKLQPDRPQPDRPPSKKRPRKVAQRRR
jgi:HEAT repeat protein